jgi:hypothetical protein
MMELTKYVRQTRDIKVFVDYEQVIGYVVVSGARGGASYVAPLYRREIYVKVRGKNGKVVAHIMSGYEQGDRLNGYSYNEDYHGCAYADVAARAIAALEFSARLRVAQAAKPVKKTKRK